MQLSDSRRLTGPSLLLEGPGAVLDVTLDPGEDAARALARVEACLRARLADVGWADARTAARAWPTGFSIAFEAPLDALYAATEVAEAALADARGAEAADAADLRSTIDAERHPALLALAEAARTHGVNFCGDEEWTTVGMGVGGRTWPTGELPAPDDVEWPRVHDVPCALVTGTNGKSTTVRLLCAIAAAAGRVVGASSTDWIRIGDELVDRDDWSGPGGARTVLRDPRVEVAVLETARGGLLRRGLAVPRVDVAVVTNVDADHLGEMGAHDVAALTEVKFVVRRAAERLVLNADDPEVRRRGADVERPVTWVTLDARDPLVAGHVAGGGTAAVLEDGALWWLAGPERTRLLPVDDVPATLGGAAAFNVTNALCAAAAARHMGLPLDAIRAGLRAFRSDPATNPGRLNEFSLGGVRVLVDFAHNPHGMRAIFALAARLPHERLAVLLGQAGDRDDASIVALATETAAARPQLVVVKHMEKYLRGRPEGEVVDLLDRTLRAQGLAPQVIAHAASELEAARVALEWSRPGDLLLLLSHEAREELLALLARLQDAGWCPGMPLATGRA